MHCNVGKFHLITFFFTLLTCSFILNFANVREVSSSYGIYSIYTLKVALASIGSRVVKNYHVACNSTIFLIETLNSASQIV